MDMGRVHYDAFSYCLKVRALIGPRFEEFCIHLNEHMEKRISIYTFCARTFPLLCAHPDLLLAMPRALGPISIQDQEIRKYFRGELIRLYSDSAPRSPNLPDLNIKLCSPPGFPTSINAGTPYNSETDKFKQIDQGLHQLLLDHEKEGGLTPILMQKYMSISSQIDELSQPMIDQAVKILNLPQKQPVIYASDTDSEKTTSDSEIDRNSKYSADRPNKSRQNEQESIRLKQHWENARQEWRVHCAQWHAYKHAQQQQQSERGRVRNEDTTRNADLLAANEYVNRLFDGDREKKWMPRKQKQKFELKRRDDDSNTL